MRGSVQQTTAGNWKPETGNSFRLVPSSLADEHLLPLARSPGLQRNARLAGRCGQELLPGLSRPMPGLSSGEVSSLSSQAREKTAPPRRNPATIAAGEYD